MKRLIRISRTRAILALAAIALIAGTTRDANAEDPELLTMGIISTESSTQLRKGFDPFVQAFSQKLGIPIKAYFATDYAGVIEAMRFNKIQLAWMGNKSAIEAVDRAEAEVFAQITKVDGSEGYHSVLIVKQDSPLRNANDVLARKHQLSFGNGDPNSTSGFLIPSYYLWTPNQINPSKDFKFTRNANHEVNCLAVAMGQVDFATCNDEALLRFEKAKPALRKRLRTIWTSPAIPNDPMVWRKDLTPELKARILGALLSFGRIGDAAAEERAILANVQDGWGPFLESDNRQLIPIREIAIEKEVQSLRFNEYIGETEKADRIHDLEAKRTQLLAAKEAIASLTNGTL